MTEIYAPRRGSDMVKQHYREILTDWPVPNEQLRVSTCQGETFIVASGPQDAPALVLLHGSGANTAMWATDVAVWAQAFRVYAVDVIGEPGYSATSRPALDSDAYACWLDDVLQALGIERAAFVGTSLGGWLALDYAIRRPTRVERLVLPCPSGIGRQKWGVIAASMFLLPFGRWGRSKLMSLALGPTTSEASLNDERLGEFVLLTHTYFKPRREKIPVFSDEALRKINIPMLVILGGRDRLLDSHATRRRLERADLQAAIVFLPETGHLLRGQTSTVFDFLRAKGSSSS